MDVDPVSQPARVAEDCPSDVSVSEFPCVDRAEDRPRRGCRAGQLRGVLSAKLAGSWRKQKLEVVAEAEPVATCWGPYPEDEPDAGRLGQSTSREATDLNPSSRQVDGRYVRVSHRNSRRIFRGVLGAALWFEGIPFTLIGLLPDVARPSWPTVAAGVILTAAGIVLLLSAIRGRRPSSYGRVTVGGASILNFIGVGWVAVNLASAPYSSGMLVTGRWILVLTLSLGVALALETAGGRNDGHHARKPASVG
jgi:hypothetical protein